MDRKEYLEERRLLASLEAEAYKSFDKSILTFSSGAIAFSMTFLNKFNEAICFNLIIASWTLWALAILFQLISYFISAKAMHEELAILNEQYKQYDEEPRLNKFTGWPSRLNIATLVSFWLGVVLFITFVIFNLDRII